MKESIIVEGLDASGKSTLVGKLSEIFDLPIHVAGGPPGGDDAALKCVSDQYAAAIDGVILDRATVISRQCYEDISAKHRKQLNVSLAYLLKRAVVIYCSPATFGEHVLKDRDSLEHLEHIEKNAVAIADRYERLMRFIPHITYDFNSTPIDDLVEEIMEIRRSSI